MNELIDAVVDKAVDEMQKKLAARAQAVKKSCNTCGNAQPAGCHKSCNAPVYGEWIPRGVKFTALTAADLLPVIEQLYCGLTTALREVHMMPHNKLNQEIDKLEGRK